ncbi:MAG: hypothetical protein ACK559_05360, partial [bacterium]
MGALADPLSEAAFPAPGRPAQDDDAGTAGGVRRAEGLPERVARGLAPDERQGPHAVEAEAGRGTRGVAVRAPGRREGGANDGRRRDGRRREGLRR